MSEKPESVTELCCATCRWWRPVDHPIWSWIQYPDRIAHPDWEGAGVCVLISSDMVPESPKQPTEARTSDPGDEGALMTQPTFGCTLWEPHDTEGTT